MPKDGTSELDRTGARRDVSAWDELGDTLRNELVGAGFSGIQ